MAQTLPPADAGTLVGDWLSLPDVASRLGIAPSRLRQLLREHRLLAARSPDGTKAVPAAFLDGSDILKGLHGTLTLLFDCGYGEDEALRWLFTAEDSLGSTPVQAISQHRITEVNRLAQALGF